MKAPGSLDDLLPLRGILEVRYQRTHRYWDVSGRLVAKIEAKLPDLTCNQLGPRGFEFTAKPASAVRSATFYWDRVALDQDPGSSLPRFEEAAAAFWGLVIDALEIKKVERVGNRWAYLFATDTVEAADSLLASRPIFSLPEALSEFGSPDARGIALRTVLPAANRRIRMELQPGEVSIKDRNLTGVMLDIDFSLAQIPSADRLDLPDFLRWNHRFLREKLHHLLRVRE